VWFGNETDVPNKFVNLTLSNVGNVGLNVIKIRLDNSIDKTDYFINTGGISRGNYFSTEVNYNWTTTEPIQITITTEKGSIYQTSVMGP
ncbi:MAG: hypothetical protein P8X83_07930, partial [Nitrosopumilaceae archaeon]